MHSAHNEGWSQVLTMDEVSVGYPPPHCVHYPPPHCVHSHSLCALSTPHQVLTALYPNRKPTSQEKLKAAKARAEKRRAELEDEQERHGRGVWRVLL